MKLIVVHDTSEDWVREPPYDWESEDEAAVDA